MKRARIDEIKERINDAKRRQIAGTRSQFDAVTLLNETEDLVEAAAKLDSVAAAIINMEQEIDRNDLTNPRVALDRLKRIIGG